MSDVRIADVVTNGGTQSRVELCESAVADYAAAIAEGVALPPIVVFHDGSTYWLADGFHRVMAATRAGVETIAADIRKGTKRDAILYSVGANATHGLPRTNADKRRSVEMLLNDVEWRAWSTSELSRQCNVSRWMVDDVKGSLVVFASEPVPTARTYTTKHGTVATMNTENIGRKQGEPMQEPPRHEQPKSRGVGLGYAHKAISFLQQIPLDDGLRDEAMDTVVQWINDNR